MYSNSNKSQLWKNVTNQALDMTHFHCVHLHVLSMFQTLMHLGSKCCKWCDCTVWSALGNMYHPHF